MARRSSIVDFDQAMMLRRGLRSSWPQLTLFLIATALGSLATVAGPLIFVHAISDMTRPTTALVGSFALFAAALALARILGDVKTVLMNRVQQDVGHLVNDNLLARIIDADSEIFAHANAGKIAAIFQSFAQSNKIYIQMFLMVIVGSISDVAVTILVVVRQVDPVVAIFVLAYGAATVALTLRANRSTEKYLHEAQKKTNENANLLGNVVADLTSIRIYGGRKWIADINSSNYLKARDSWNSFYNRRVGYGAMQGFLVFLQYCGAFAVLLVLHQKGTGLSAILLLVLLLGQLNRPFELIGTSLRDFAVARSMATPALELLPGPGQTQLSPVQPSTGDGACIPDAAPVISVRGLTVRYGNDQSPALADFNADFRPGRINFIVGASGSGKTTLLNALLRLHHNYTGAITIAGVDLRNFCDQDYWAAVGYVPQQPMMMNVSIRDNLLLGRRIGESDIDEALRAVHLEEKVTSLPGGTKFIIGEGGRLLSGGERQRLSIARALLSRPKILILDEASSALDEETETAVFNALRRVADGTTIIAVTHRLNSISPHDATFSVGIRGASVGA